MCEHCQPSYVPPVEAREAVGSFNETLRDRSQAVQRSETPYAVVSAAEVLSRTPGSPEWYEAVEDMLSLFPEVPWDMPGPQYLAVATSLVLSHKAGQAHLN